MKKLDAFAGRCAVAFLPVPAGSAVAESLASILLIRPGGIGDAVLLLPAILTIRKQYPDAQITVLAEKRNVQVFRRCPAVDVMLCYDRPCEFILAMKGRYDLVIDTEQWYRLSAVVARLVRAQVRIGFDTNERLRMFTHRVPYDQHAYEADSFLALLKPLGIAPRQDIEADTLSISSCSVSKAERLIQPLSSQPFITIFPGASIREKRWGADRFRLVAEMLSASGINMAVVGGKEDRQQGEVIAGGGLGLNLAGLTSLAETAAVIQKSALLVSGDSGVLHIAVGLGVPTVSLFGSGRVEKWAPRGENHIVINKRLPCSPCALFGNTPPCPIDTKCMKDISVDEVVDAVKKLLFYTER